MVGTIKHGKTNTRLFVVWSDMKSRCYHKGDKGYKNYGGRGIMICDEWKNDFQAFYDWAYANGYDENAPRGKFTIDRIDVNGNYEPSNCRWVDNKTQANNRTNNRFIVCNGVKKTVTEWADELGIDNKRILRRLKKGFSDEETILIPYKKPLIFTANGKTQTPTQWAKELGINRTTLLQRKRYGWSDEKIINTKI